MDGTKLYLENDNWALLRFSGTEPVLRLAVEADSPEKAQELMRLAAAVRTAENGTKGSSGGNCDTATSTTRTANMSSSGRTCPVSWTNYLGVEICAR